MGYAVALVALCALLGPAPSPADIGPSPRAGTDQVEATVDARSSCADGERRKTVRLRCRRDARGGMAGEYGGVPLSLFCEGNTASTSICAAGTAYGMRVSSETGVAVDCFFTGDSRGVNETCDAVRVSIHRGSGRLYMRGRTC